VHKDKLLLDEQVRMRNCLSLAFPAGFGNRGLMEQEWLIVLLNWCISQIEYGNLFGIKEENPIMNKPKITELTNHHSG